MAVSNSGRLILRQASQITSRTTTRQTLIRTPSSYALTTRARRDALDSAVVVRPRFFSAYTKRYISIMPEAEDPPPKKSEPHAQASAPTEIEDAEYHERADHYMELVHEKAEQIQEGKDDVEVEFAAGVLSITFPPNGTYIINKQPPNKQIWLSSPITGPKRFDWVLTGEGMNQKEGGGQGDWIYLRDHTSLTEILRKELGITIDTTQVEEVKPSVDAVE